MADSRGITADIFDVLGVRPAIGRTFAAEEDQVPGRDRVAVISHAFWAARFNQDATTVGRTVRLNGFRASGRECMRDRRTSPHRRTAVGRVCVPGTDDPELKPSEAESGRDAGTLRAGNARDLETPAAA